MSTPIFPAVGDDGKIRESHLPTEVVDGAVPLREHNLFDVEDTTLATISGANGNLVAHATNLTSGFIPVIGGENYVSYHQIASRVVWFDVDKNFIAGTNTDWIPSNTTQMWTAPPAAAFARMTMAVSSTDPNVPPMIFNRGDVLWSPGLAISTGWWDDKELPPQDLGLTPHIGPNGNWWIGDEDTGTPAQGPPGTGSGGGGLVPDPDHDGLYMIQVG